MKKIKESELNIRIDTDLKLLLSKISYETGISVSEIVRFSLNNFINCFELIKKYVVPTEKD